MADKSPEEWVAERKGDNDWVDATINVFSEEWLVGVVEKKGVDWFEEYGQSFVDSMDVVVGLDSD